MYIILDSLFYIGVEKSELEKQILDEKLKKIKNIVAEFDKVKKIKDWKVVQDERWKTNFSY